MEPDGDSAPRRDEVRPEAETAERPSPCTSATRAKESDAFMSGHSARMADREAEISDKALDVIDEALDKFRSDMAAT